MLLRGSSTGLEIQMTALEMSYALRGLPRLLAVMGYDRGTSKEVNVGLQVTAGGSVCIESLTQAGTRGAWQPSFSVETILNVVLTNLIDCEVVHIQTLTGPGGLTGPLRVDLAGR